MPGAIVADANVILSALIGGRAGLVLVAANGPRCYATTVVHGEVRRYLPILAAKRHLSLANLFLAFAVLPVIWCEPDAYAAFEAAAKGQLSARDETDWPTLALALARSLPIWSQDKDFSVTSVKTFTTGILLDLLQAERDAADNGNA